MMNTIINKLDTAKAHISKHYNLKLMKVSKPETYSNEYGEGTYNLARGGAKLEGTRQEHWSPAWAKILKKYLLADGSNIDPEKLPFDMWIDIQTNPDREIRKAKTLVWVIPAETISETPFEVPSGKDTLKIDPAVDVVCIGGDETGPNLDWGIWPVKKEIFQDTYEEVHR